MPVCSKYKTLLCRSSKHCEVNCKYVKRYVGMAVEKPHSLTMVGCSQMNASQNTSGFMLEISFFPIVSSGVQGE